MIVKFCGMRRMEDIKNVNVLKPDLVGFILDPTRKRYVDPKDVSVMKANLAEGIKAVGVFVNEEISKVSDLLNGGIIDIAQLHGDESEDYIRKLKDETGATVIKAFGIRSDEDIKRAEESCADLIIVDAPGGGTGKTFNWELLKKLKRDYILAGGLNEKNIKEAMALSPYGVDVSSGIETDGYKDMKKMEDFISIVRKG